jgi:membrane protease YdiL (CAAX protease family)
MSHVPPSYTHPGGPPPRPEVPEGVELPPEEPRERERGPERDRPRRDRTPRWPVWAPFAAMALTVILAMLGALLIGGIVDVAGSNFSPDDPPPGVTIGGTYVQDLALIFSALFLANALGGRPTPRQFGLRETRLGPAALRVAGVWVAFFVFSGLWALALNIDQEDDLPQELGADESTTALVAVAILVCVLAPIAEEFFFRGFCFTALRRRIGLAGGAIVTGAVFGAIHLGSSDPEFIVPLAVFGLLLCLLYAWTRSLLPCIVLHALNNSLALGVTQDWPAPAVVLLMLGSAGTVLAITIPIARSPRLNAAPAAT